MAICGVCDLNPPPPPPTPSTNYLEVDQSDNEVRGLAPQRCFFPATLSKVWGSSRGWQRLLEKSDIAGSNTTMAFKFQNKMFFPCSLVKIQYCGEPPWLRGSVLGLRPPGLELESFVSRAVSSHSSHHPQKVLLAQISICVHKCGLKSHSFHFAPDYLWSLHLIGSQCSRLRMFPLYYSHE